MTVFFTADTHFGHKRIIELASRPFADLAAMDDAMVQRWNERVRPGDIVYHLGDFAFADPARYLNYLNGLKVLILGNHDRKRLSALKSWFEFVVDGLFEIEADDDTHLVLCHYGMRVWNRSHHGAIHLYGHSHGNLPGDSQSCDVGVDCWDFRPVTLPEIKARLATQPLRNPPDHHRPPV